MSKPVALLTKAADRRKLFRVVEPPPNRLAEIRKLRHLTQAELAELINDLTRVSSTQQQIYRHENGISRIPDDNLRAYATVLDCSEQDILGPPRKSSVFGYTKGPGELGPPLNEDLIARVIEFVEAGLGGGGDARKKARLVTVIYASAIRDSAEQGLPPERLELERYAGMIRLVA